VLKLATFAAGEDMTKNSMKFVSAMLGFSFLFVGCSGGSSQHLDGRQCAVNDMVAEVTDPAQKISLKADAKAIPTTTYTYQGADLYYVGPTDLRVHVRHGKLENGTFRAGVDCVRNASPELLKGSLVVNTIDSLTIDQANQVSAHATQIGFEFVNKTLKVVPVENTSNAAVTDLTAQFGEDAFLYKVKDKSYDLRSEGVTQDKGRYTLSVHFTTP
jgi:hypothetical protein